MNINKMMKQMQKMQKEMQDSQAALATRTVEASVGGGKVTVTATGAGEVTAIKISKDVVDPDDVEMLEDLILSGVRQAIESAKEMANAEMQKVTAGLPPGLL